jgi:hypothetical protein
LYLADLKGHGLSFHTAPAAQPTAGGWIDRQTHDGALRRKRQA